MPESIPSDPPNVLIIYSDDTDRDIVGCYGGEGLTPNIDRLAEDGLRFERYYSASPVCTPSRYCALTGQYASRSENLQCDYPPGEPVNIGFESGIYWESAPHNMASVLGDHGYTTGMVGKWHQGIPDEEMHDIPPDGEEPDVYTLFEQMSNDIDAVEPTVDGHDPEIDRLLRENYETVLEAVRSTGFDYAASVYESNPLGMNLPLDMRHHNMDWVTRGALDFLDQHAGDDEPFFLWMAPTCTHSPFGEEQLRSDPTSTPAGYLDGAPDVQPSRESVVERVREADANAWNRGPLATWMDDGIGAVLDRLEELGVAGNTLVIYTTDHADLSGKGSVYQNGSRLPFVVRYPAEVDPARPCSRLAENVDIAPTVYDLAGVDPDHGRPIDGRSMLSLLTGEGSYEREYLYQEMGGHRGVVSADRFHYVATRFPEEIQAAVDEGERYSHHWQQIEDPAEVRWGVGADFPDYFDQDQLYDLEADPDEQHNLAADPRYADKLEELRGEMRAFSQDLPHAFGEFTETPR